MSFRPVLRPGAPLLRRDASHLQIGTSPGIVIADRPGLLALLHLLDGARDLERLELIAGSSIPELDGTVTQILAELRSLGAVFDASRWIGTRGLDAEARHLDLAGADPSLVTARTSFRLAFHTDAACAPIIDLARAVLERSGVTMLDSLDPELVVIASCGEPSRAVFESPTLAGLDHLPFVIDEDRARIGPYVRPGHTPCTSCDDLHRADWDRSWPALVHQLGRHTGTITPPAISALTAHAAALELAAEIIARADGTDLRTLGSCLAVGPGHCERASWPLAFHHACACDLLNAA